VRHPLGLSVVWLAVCSLTSHVAPAVLDAMQRNRRQPWRAFPASLLARRRLYGSFLIHLGFVCFVVGVSGSSLGSRQRDVVMQPGDEIQWAGRSIRFHGLIERDQPDRFIVEADLEINSDQQSAYRLRPAQHLHRLQDQWTTEVAIHSTWSADFYTILHHGEEGGAVRITLIENPLIRCMWFGGWVIAFATTIRLWPSRRRVIEPDGVPPVQPTLHPKRRKRRPEFVHAQV
jgi:cytochrome c-type biogenesis protein CcmF